MTRKKKAPLWRGPFLRALGVTGNVRLSAERAGIDYTTAYAARRRDADLAKGWERALARAKEKADRPPPSPACGRGSLENLVVRNSKRSGRQIVKAGAGRWNAKAEAAFLARLKETGNIRKAARAAGFSTTTVHKRLNQYPAFAEASQEAIVRARTDFESMVLGAGIATFDRASAEEDDPLPDVTVAEAIAILRLKPSEKGRPGRQGADVPEEPSIEEVRANILRKLDAIEAAERRKWNGESGPDLEE